MPDTSRTSDELLNTIFADGQLAGSITPQDIRDLIVSLKPTMGSGRFSTPATFNIVSAGAFVGPSTGTTELAIGTDDVDMPINGRLRYIGTIQKHFLVNVSISATVAGNNQDIQFRLTKNGIAISESLTSRTWGTGADAGHLSIITAINMIENDYIGIEVANNTSTADITISGGNIVILGSLH